MRGLRRYVRPSMAIQFLATSASAGKVTTHQMRFQAGSDKKFHCTICKKSFRLEMAAKLHIQQVHGGAGTIEAGAGPGVEAVAAPVTAAPAGPPTAPIARDDIDDRRRERPTPRPLHQSNYEVPAAAMEALLGVWDTIGTKRGVEGFVHSSMVLKVYAAKPSGPESAYTNLMPKPEGPNPFEEWAKAAARKTWPDPIPSKNPLPPCPFKVANGSLLTPLDCAWITNPYTHRSLAPKREAAKAVKNDEPTEAPVTPFGQLPKFGQAAPPTNNTTTTAAASAPSANAAASSSSASTSPFAAAAAAANPFAAAAAAASPFAAAAAQAASPFAAAAQAASPFGNPQTTAPSPFAAAAAAGGGAAASPFGGAAAASPFAAAAGGQQQQQQQQLGFGGAAAPPSSPFGASPFSPSPFTNGAVVPPPVFPPFPGFEAFAASAVSMGVAVPAAAAEEKKISCSVCGRAFKDSFALAMHSKQKHNIEVPASLSKESGSRKRDKVPDLPAYVPSPVDLSSTSPFGAEPTSATQRWGDVELIPHALSVNNITIVGVVGEMKVGGSSNSDSSDAVAYLTVRVDNEAGTDEFVVRCPSDALLAGGVRAGSAVCVVGCLRLHPTLDEGASKYYNVPIVHITGSNGTLAAID